MVVFPSLISSLPIQLHAFLSLSLEKKANKIMPFLIHVPHIPQCDLGDIGLCIISVARTL